MAKSASFHSEVQALGEVLQALSSLDERRQEFVMRAAADRLGIQNLAARIDTAPQNPKNGNGTQHAPATGTLQGLNPKQFIDQRKPATDVERIACLAYYLTHARNQPHFKTTDLTKLNTEAAQPKFSNAAYATRNATSQNGYLAPAGKGQKQITSLGEKVVLALPDREEVKKVLDSHKSRSRKKRRRKKHSSAKPR